MPRSKASTSAQTEAARLKDLISEIRKRFRLSYRKFAEMLGLTHSTIGRWESGKGKVGRNSKRLIADLVNRSVIDLDLYLDGSKSLDDFLGEGAIQSSSYEEALRLLPKLTSDEVLGLVRVAPDYIKPGCVTTSLPLNEAFEQLKGFLNCLVNIRHHDGYSLAEIAEILEQPSDRGLIDLVERVSNGKDKVNKRR